MDENEQMEEQSIVTTSTHCHSLCHFSISNRLKMNMILLTVVKVIVSVMISF